MHGIRVNTNVKNFPLCSQAYGSFCKKLIYHQVAFSFGQAQHYLCDVESQLDSSCKSLIGYTFYVDFDLQSILDVLGVSCFFLISSQ